ncbi:MAG: Rieske 2Fe-2S domain-containing protein, partial [Phycisphaerae bacterium]|nr:Rieske 2Fe-2S domain-containing protein [Phycisphaerae bacterium]
LGFLMVNIGGVTYLFSLPRFEEGEFGGQFPLGRADEVLPPPGGDPINMPKGRFWLVRNAEGSVLAIYKVCTHLGCLYNWQSQNNRFYCPCHGSQFQLDGTYIQGPAPRSLDRFVVKLVDGKNQELASTNQNGDPLAVPSVGVNVVVETNKLILGAPRGGSA